MVSNKGYGIPSFVFVVVAIAVIVSAGVISIAYSEAISKVSTAGYDLQTLAIFGSIFIPLTFLIFINIIKNESWKKFRGNKSVSILISIFLLVALYFLFAGASLSISNAQQSVLAIYIAISMSLIIFVCLFTFYIYIDQRS